MRHVTTQGTSTTAVVEKQGIETLGLHDREFVHNCDAEVSDSAEGFLPGVLQVALTLV